MIDQHGKHLFGRFSPTVVTMELKIVDYCGAGGGSNQIELCKPLMEFKKIWPPVIKATKLDELTGDAYKWATLQNEISRGDAPADICMAQGSRKRLIVRDHFLPYWQTKLTVPETT